MHLKFQVNLAEVPISLFPMYLKFQVNLAEVSLSNLSHYKTKKKQPIKDLFTVFQLSPYFV